MRFIRYPSLAIFLRFLWTEKKSRSIKTQKRTRPISRYLDWTSFVNNGFIMAKTRTFFLRDQREISRESKNGLGCQQEHRIRFILPARGFGHITKFLTFCTPFIGDNSWITILIFSILLGLLAYIMTQIGLFFLLLLAITMSQAGKYFHCHAIKEKNQNCSIQYNTITLFKEGRAITYYSFLTYGPQKNR